MKKLLAALLLLASFGASAQVSTIALLTDRTTTNGCSAVDARVFNPVRVFHAYGSTTAGAGASVIAIWGSNDGTHWAVLGTITLTLSTSATAAAGNDGFTTNANWSYVCANVTSISGTNAKVTAVMGGN